MSSSKKQIFEKIMDGISFDLRPIRCSLSLTYLQVEIGVISGYLDMWR